MKLSYNQSSNNSDPSNKGKTKWKTRAEMLEDKAQEESEADELNRPKYKVLMLSGPPGLGKTTLAHVAAMHSGEFSIYYPH